MLKLLKLMKMAMTDKSKNALKEFARALLAAIVALVTSLLTSCNIHNNSYPRDPYAVSVTRASLRVHEGQAITIALTEAQTNPQTKPLCLCRG